MKVLVVGATGKIGGLIIAECLSLGHEVTAYGRSVDRIKPAKGLYVAKGDVHDAASIEAVMPDHDVVVLTFGAIASFGTLLFGTDVCEAGTRNVITAMKSAGVRRLIAMTSIGAGDSSGHGSWPFRNIIKPVILGRIMKDRTRQEQLVRSSDLPEWVIVRPAELNDGPRSERLRLFTAFDGESEPSNIARASVAAFLAKSASDHTHGRGSVLISN
jgi:nucleoside-diphosphate-sugar epimerase